MNNWYEWFFEGIGTEIIILIIGLVIGNISGYKIAKLKYKQAQTAGDWSNQKQSIRITDNSNASTNNISQSQKAGNNSTQVQVGDIHAK